MTLKTRQHKSVQAKPHIHEKNLNPQHHLSHGGQTGPPSSRGPTVASSQAPINAHSSPRTLLFQQPQGSPASQAPWRLMGKSHALASSPWGWAGMWEKDGEHKAGEAGGSLDFGPSISISLVTWTKPLPPSKCLWQWALGCKWWNSTSNQQKH